MTNFSEEIASLLPGQAALGEGEVALVGAGPGDPELLTLKALRLLQQADVVFYDFLVSEEIMQLVPATTETISVGKRAGSHSASQEQINEVLLAAAREGKRVVRLKGGDPFIFGRGGEEMEYLLDQQIPCQVVPGITAAAGCSVYAGIPLTHRGYANSVQFITGHCQANGKTIDWSSLSTQHQTLVIYMGLMRSETISAELQAHGRAGTTPVAIVERGTTPQQRVFTGELSQLASLINEHNIQSPGLIIVGEVVSLQQKLRWWSPSEPVQDADRVA